jgi:hypothetical protein
MTILEFLGQRMKGVPGIRKSSENDADRAIRLSP